MIHRTTSDITSTGRTTAPQLRVFIASKSGDVLPLTDFASMLIAAWLGFITYSSLYPAALEPAQAWQAWHRLIWVAAALAPFILYDRRFSVLACADKPSILVQGFAWRFCLLLGVFAVFVFGGRWMDEMPLGYLSFWLATALLLTAAIRLLLARSLRQLTRSGRLAESVAVIGCGALADRVIPMLGSSASLYGVFEDRSTRDEPFGYKPDSTIDQFIRRAAIEPPDRILIALPAAAEQRLLTLVQRLSPLGIALELCPQSFSFDHSATEIGYVADTLPVTLFADRPIRRWNILLKSAKDIVLTSVLTILLLPVLACIALAIKLDSPGPVLFRQRRHGFRNGEFDIYKFRTMYYTPIQPSGALEQTLRGDPRITRVGRLLRKTSLDELPQVFNVLGGSMSLVGPRPHAVNMRTESQLGHEITDRYPHRCRVKPGITGWSQINGSRGATDTIAQLQRRVELDLHYVDHWSLMLDLKILCRTFRAVLRGTNAY